MAQATKIQSRLLLDSRNYLRPEHQVFLTICKHRNITRAGEDLGIGQSNASKLVAKLENEIGKKLLARMGRGVNLTPDGELLEQHLKNWLRLWEQSINEHSDKWNQRRIKVGGHRSVLCAHFPKLASRFFRLHPETEATRSFQFEFGTSQEITRRVMGGELDVGIVVNHVRTADLVARKISTDFQAVWSCAGSKTTRIAFNPEMMDRARILKHIPVQNLFEVPDYHLILSMVLEDSCKGILPDSLAKPAGLIQNGEVLKRVDVSIIYTQARSRALSLKSWL